jgi:hypothetical protein
MSLKETIFSMMNEALENMDEAAVEVSNQRYTPSHSKQPRGSGSWMFTHKSKGDVDVNNKKEVHTAQGKFSDAKKSAQAWAKEHGHSTVYVMEEVEQIDELKVPSKFQKAVFKLAHGKTPKEYAAFNKADSEYQSSDTLKRLKVGRTDDNTYKKGETPKDKNSIIHGSPAHMQIRAIDRELKKRNEEVELDENWSKGASSSYRSDAIAAAKQKAKAASLSTAANKLGKDNPQHNELMSNHHKAMAKFVKHSYHSGAYPSMAIAKKDYNSHMDQAKKYNSAVTENYELDEAKTDIYHKHMLKALGKTRLPKDHPYTSAVTNNGDFVVRNGSGVVARIPKGEHNLK